MKILLAGYNIDSSVLEELGAEKEGREDITPETLSAAYARISRDPSSVDKLREAARNEVKKARKSNRNIIFKMGHHSVAEHAVFNFDIMDVSRLAIEEIQRFRLCSFTEKSQRYITLEGDYLLPQEVKNAGMEKIFKDTIQAQNNLYEDLYKQLKPYFFKQNKQLASDSKKHSLLEGWAKEDARYIVSLATFGQMGMTVNARNLEYIIRRFASNELEEIRELNRILFDLAGKIAPSLLLFTEKNDFDSKTYEAIKSEANQKQVDNSVLQKKAVSLVDFTQDADRKLIAAFLFSTSEQCYKNCLENASKMSIEQRMSFLKKAFQYMEFYDFVQREFEVINLTFEVNLSASSFAQLKRHRMATITVQDYNPELGITVPPSITAVGAEKKFREIIDQTEAVYYELKNRLKKGAEYILTNSHRRRVMVHLNARELYHISRLREDKTAQWDIREISQQMSLLAEQEMPLTCLLLGGKDNFPSIYEKVFGKKPKMELPPN